VTWPARIGVTAGAALAVWVTGFVQGRRGRGELACPAVAQAQAKTDDRSQADAKAEHHEQAAMVASRAKHTHRVRKLAIAPDGTKNCDETLDTYTDDRQAASVSAQGTQASSLAQSHAAIVTVVQRAPWQLGLLAGVNASAVTGADRRWWLGATATHAFLGPLRWGLVVKRQDGSTDVGIVGEVEF
jgi:hypothetical protein